MTLQLLHAPICRNGYLKFVLASVPCGGTCASTETRCLLRSLVSGKLLQHRAVTLRQHGFLVPHCAVLRHVTKQMWSTVNSVVRYFSFYIVSHHNDHITLDILRHWFSDRIQKLLSDGSVG